MYGFFWFVLSWKQGQKLVNLLVINEILIIWGWLLAVCLPRVFLEIAVWVPTSVTYSRLASWAGCHRLEFGFLGQSCRLGLRIIFLCMVWLLSVYTFSLLSSLTTCVKFSIQLNSKVFQVKRVCPELWFVFLIKTTTDRTIDISRFIFW